MFYHYYENGAWVYYSFSVPVNVAPKGTNGFLVDIPESVWFHRQVYELTWANNCGSATGTYSINDGPAQSGEWWDRPSILVNSASAQFGTVFFALSGPAGPASVAASATFEFVANDGSVVTHTTPGTYLGDQWYTAPFPRTALARDVYSRVRGRWNMPGASGPSELALTNPWQVKGDIHYSGYNTPDQADSSCQGTPVDAWVVDSLKTCSFTRTQFTPIFMTQVQQNGTGLTGQFGLIKAGTAAVSSLGTSCRNKFPAGANTDNSFLMVDAVKGQCDIVLVPDVSVAVAPGPARRGSEYSCGNELLLVDGDVDFQNRAVQDACGACNDNPTGHYDAYRSNPSCDSGLVGNLGDFWTLKK